MPEGDGHTEVYPGKPMNHLDRTAPVDVECDSDEQEHVEDGDRREHDCRHRPQVQQVAQGQTTEDQHPETDFAPDDHGQDR